MGDTEDLSVEQEEDWIFTFGCGMAYEGHYVKIHGTFMSARLKMIERYGRMWAFQYSQAEWDAWVAEATREGFPVETELKLADF